MDRLDEFKAIRRVFQTLEPGALSAADQEKAKAYLAMIDALAALGATRPDIEELRAILVELLNPVEPQSTSVH